MRILSFIVLLMVSCQHYNLEEDQIDPLPNRWEKFIGEYEVYDPTFDYFYEMEIKYLGPAFDSFGQPTDSLEIINFVDRFDLRVTYFDDLTDTQILFFDVIQPAFDHSGDRYNINLNSTMPSEDFPEFGAVNTLYDDTMIISGIVNNSIYYIEDGTPFTSLNFEHKAVRQ